MRISFSGRRVAAIAVLVFGVLAGHTPAACAGSWSVSGSYLVTSIHGNRFDGIATGRATPGGPFTGTFTSKGVRGESDFTGTHVLDFGGGNSLTFTWQTQWDDQLGGGVGTYLITGGTGRLAGATGSGDFWYIYAGDGTGTFFLDGTLSR